MWRADPCFARSGFRPRTAMANLSNVHVFHAHRFIPAENLLVGVFRLILRRIPVEGIEHPGFRGLLPVHRKNMMNQPSDRTDQPTALSSEPWLVVEDRHRNFEDAVQRLGLHLAV